MLVFAFLKPFIYESLIISFLRRLYVYEKTEVYTPSSFTCLHNPSKLEENAVWRQITFSPLPFPIIKVP